MAPRKAHANGVLLVRPPQNEVAFSSFLGSLSPQGPRGFWEEDRVCERILPGKSLVFPFGMACPFIHLLGCFVRQGGEEQEEAEEEEEEETKKKHEEGK